MNLVYENLVNSFLENEVGQSHDFLPEGLARNLRNNLIKLADNNKMYQAGIGHNQDLRRGNLYRSDNIFWLDSKSEDEFERSFFTLIDSFILFLNETCYAGITNYEFHYALYPKGSFYRKHLDQFKENESRAFSMIMYLNDSWKEGDGGELMIYKAKENDKIAPRMGKMVFFDSAVLPHEVLETKVPRLSITGWLRRDS